MSLRAEKIRLRKEIREILNSHMESWRIYTDRRPTTEEATNLLDDVIGAIDIDGYISEAEYKSSMSNYESTIHSLKELHHIEIEDKQAEINEAYSKIDELKEKINSGEVKTSLEMKLSDEKRKNRVLKKVISDLIGEM